MKQPLDCDFTDNLEAWSTLGKTVHMRYGPEGEAAHEAEGVIVDLFIRDGQEYLKLNNGTDVLLTDIREIAPIQH